MPDIDRRVSERRCQCCDREVQMHVSRLGELISKYEHDLSALREQLNIATKCYYVEQIPKQP